MPASSDRSSPPAGAPVGAAPAGDVAGRYEDRFLVGQGGMGEVRLVYDRHLRRTAVMKVIRPHLAGTAAARRLQVEAEITARLQHPGVVPVYDAGVLLDGRPFYVMREVHGRTLADAIAAVHRVSVDGMWRPDPDGFTFRRLVDAFLRVCETMAYAHDQRVVHRDLKPSNVMLEAFGSVLVLDWGIAKRVRSAQPEAPLPAPTDGAYAPGAPRGPDSYDAGTLVLDLGLDGGTEVVALDIPPGHADDPPVLDATRAGAVLGTPGYMAPEQAAGCPIGPPADVHALGAMLHVLLHGTRPPTPREFGASAPHAPPPGLDETPMPTDPRVPEALARLARRAMAHHADRRPTAAAMVGEVAAWLDGVRRRDEAMELVARADAITPDIAALRARADTLDEQARLLLEPIAPHAPADEKVPGWRLQDEAERLRAEAVGREELWTQLLHGARELVAELPEAQMRLADYYRERHAAAEAARDRAAATRAEVRLRAHDHGRHRAWLAGDGTLSLDTDPSGAEVTLYRYVLRDRRLVPERVGPLGRTPLSGVTVPWGSLLLRIAGPASEVDVPVLVGRAEDWALLPPGAPRPTPLWLPRPGDLGPDECYVPAGWFQAGGDPRASDPLPTARWWADGFVMQRFPVSNGEYLAFLNDLVARGWGEEAGARVPRRSAGSEHEGGVPVFSRDPGGTFGLPCGEGAAEHPDEPVVCLSWLDVRAYAEWLARREGRPWRLPHELEWEKAARGPDGRLLPWGDFLEPTWANVLDGPIRPPRRVAVDTFPIDASPYGVRGLAGNVRDWCGNAWRREGPRSADGRFDPAAGEEEGGAFMSLRGGGFQSSRTLLHSATRFAASPSRRYTVSGARLVRPYGLV